MAKVLRANGWARRSEEDRIRDVSTKRPFFPMDQVNDPFALIRIKLAALHRDKDEVGTADCV